MCKGLGGNIGCSCCMIIRYSKSKDQPGKVKVANLARDPFRVSLLLAGFLASSATAPIYLFKYPYAIGSAPGLSGRTNAYRFIPIVGVGKTIEY